MKYSSQPPDMSKGTYSASLSFEDKGNNLSKAINAWLSQPAFKHESWQDLEKDLYAEDNIIYAKDDQGAGYRINLSKGDMMKFTPDADGKLVTVDYWEEISFTQRFSNDNQPGVLIVDNAPVMFTRVVPFITGGTDGLKT